MSQSTRIEIAAERTLTQTCRLPMTTALSPNQSGLVRLSVSEPDAGLWVNGAPQPLSGQLTELLLPLGPRAVEVRRDGFQVALAGGIAAGALGVAGVVLFIVGDEPDRYERFHVGARPGAFRAWWNARF